MNKFCVHHIQQILLSLFGGVAGHFLKQLLLILAELFGFGVFGLGLLNSVVEGFFFFVDVLELTIEGLFLLKQPLFGKLNFLAAFFEFLVSLGTKMKNLILSLDHHFFFPAFGIAKRFILQLRGLFVGVADDLARLAFTFGDTHISRFQGRGIFGLFSLVLTLGNQISDEYCQDNYHYAYHNRPNGLLIKQCADYGTKQFQKLHLLYVKPVHLALEMKCVIQLNTHTSFTTGEVHEYSYKFYTSVT